MQDEAIKSLTEAFPLPLPPVPFGKDMWQALAEEDRPLLVYGMGNGADKLMDRLASFGRAPSAVFASDGFVRGQVFRGYTVLSYEEAARLFPHHVVLVSFGSNRADVVSYLYDFAARVPCLIPDMPLAGEDYFTASFYEACAEELKMVYEMLADDASRDLLASLVWYKLTGKPAFLRRAVCDSDTEALLGWSTVTSAVDVGAYRGDTLKELALRAPCLQRVIALEPDPKNFKKLSLVAASYPALSVTCVEGAAWDADGELPFAASGNRNATLENKETKGHTPSFEHQLKTVKTFKIDTITQGRTVDYIKIDTEGAELSCLRGAEQTVSLGRPGLRVSLYHRSEDLFALPLFLEANHPLTYSYYIRREDVIPAWECDLIAVPKQKGEE